VFPDPDHIISYKDTAVYETQNQNQRDDSEEMHRRKKLVCQVFTVQSGEPTKAI